MNYTIYDYLGLFFFYAFLGWLLETSVAAIRKKHMVNRGFLNGPLCAIYGITAVFMTRYLYELQSSPVFLFLGCMIIATAVEWLAGHALERIGHGKWWDYSNKKWNMDGYICLQYSVLWGILGLLAMKIGNRLCFTVLHLIPAGFLHITSWILFGILIVDAVGSYAVLHHITKKMPRISAMNDQIDAFTRRLSVRVYRYLERRVERAYPAVQPVSEKKEKTETGVFAEGCSFYRRCLDEPQQPCMGPVQHRLGPGHRPRYLVPLQLPRPLRWIPVCLWYLPRRSLRIHLQCVHRNRIRKSLLGLQRHSLQPRRPYQPPVLFLLGNSRRRLAQKILSCHFALD